MKTKTNLIASLILGLAASGAAIAMPAHQPAQPLYLPAVQSEIVETLGIDQLARRGRGADDRHRDDRGGRRRHSEDPVDQLARRGRGADDRGFDDRGGRRGRRG